MKMKREIWVFLFFVGLFLFNWPFIHIFETSLPSYLFSLWFVLIGLTYLFLAFAEDEDGGK